MRLLKSNSKIVYNSVKKAAYIAPEFIPSVPVSAGLNLAYLPGGVSNFVFDGNGTSVTAVKQAVNAYILQPTAFVGNQTITIPQHGMSVDDYFILESANGYYPTGLGRDLYKVRTVVDGNNILIKTILNISVFWTAGTGIASQCKVYRRPGIQLTLANKPTTVSALNNLIGIRGSAANNVFTYPSTNTNTLAVLFTRNNPALGIANAQGICSNALSTGLYFHYATDKFGSGTEYKYFNGTTTTYPAPVTTMPVVGSPAIIVFRTNGTTPAPITTVLGAQDLNIYALLGYSDLKDELTCYQILNYLRALANI